MKLGIVGSRDPKISYAEWEPLLLGVINIDEATEVVSGGAKGIDTLAKIFAARHHIPYMEFAPNYKDLGQYVTLRRNTQVIKESSCVVAYHTAESRRTLHTISEAQRMGKRVIVVKI